MGRGKKIEYILTILAISIETPCTILWAGGKGLYEDTLGGGIFLRNLFTSNYSTTNDQLKTFQKNLIRFSIESVAQMKETQNVRRQLMRINRQLTKDDEEAKYRKQNAQPQKIQTKREWTVNLGYDLVFGLTFQPLFSFTSEYVNSYVPGAGYFVGATAVVGGYVVKEILKNATNLTFETVFDSPQSSTEQSDQKEGTDEPTSYNSDPKDMV